MNVRNDGRTSVKRMRARLRFSVLPKSTIMRTRPEGVSEEDWQRTTRVREEFEARIQKEVAESQFGRPLPFSTTPSGTIGRPWLDVDFTLLIPLRY
jgi:hypothetical protein